MKNSALALFFACFQVAAGAAEVFPGTEPLAWEGDLAARMVKGIDVYLDRDLEGLRARREKYWPDTLEATKSNRTELRRILGLVDGRSTPRLERISETHDGIKITRVRWNVFRGVHGDGLLLEGKETKANVVAIPDADWTPEMLAANGPSSFARTLAASGCRVLVPFLIDRSDTYAGLPGVRTIHQTEREVLWRAAYEMGRTLAGYETAKVMAAVDYFEREHPGVPIGVFGYGEGGMLALFAGALDERIQSTGVSGYFQPRENLYQEPIYRNVWGFLERFGDAELAGLVSPRNLVIEAARYPETEYPAPGGKSDGAAPGKLTVPDAASVENEAKRAAHFWGTSQEKLTLVKGGREEAGSNGALAAFLKGLGILKVEREASTSEQLTAPAERALSQYMEILEDTQYLMRESEFTRNAFWGKADRKSAEAFARSTQSYKDYFWDEVVGRLPRAALPPQPRSRLVYETNGFRGYEIVLDVYPDVFAYGILLVPKNIRSGEKRPVVVCQHGLEGRPTDVADPKLDHYAYHTYACRLAEQGFVTFAPQNPYIGHNTFRQVLRKAQPLKKTLFSFIVRQHEVILDWLASLDFVDDKRLAFYGLSYGGKTAMRVPSLLDRYCLSICSADYNEWIWKNVSIRHTSYCYLYGGEYDMPEFNLGNTFNYAELSWLILPRPFMVERGHEDTVAPDEWVAYEFAKTRRMYDKLGLGDRVAMEVFNGPHTIHGKGTFEFLHKHLNWPQSQ